MDHHRDPCHYLHCLHPCAFAWNEGHLPSFRLLYVPVFRPLSLCFVRRRRNPLYPGNRIFRHRKPGAEFLQHGDLYGSAADDSLPAELDHLLLGVLDGMVRGLPVLYRQHLQRTDGASDDPWRLRLQLKRNLFKFFNSWQLQPGTAGKRKAERHGHLRRRERPVRDHPGRRRNPAPGSHGHDPFSRRHDRILRHQL